MSSDLVAEAVSSSCHHLRSLSLTYVTNLTDIGMQTLRFCGKKPGSQLIGSSNNGLTSLELHFAGIQFCRRVSPRALLDLASSHPSLQSFKLNHYGVFPYPQASVFFDTAHQQWFAGLCLAMSASVSTLTDLSVRGCVVDDQQFAHLSTFCRLETFHASCQLLSFQNLQKIVGSGCWSNMRAVSLVNANHLASIHVSCQTICVVIKNNWNMENFIVFSQVALLAVHCPSLFELCLSHCVNLNDSALAVLRSHSKNLRKLSISYSPLLTYFFLPHCCLVN